MVADVILPLSAVGDKGHGDVFTIPSAGSVGACAQICFNI